MAKKKPRTPPPPRRVQAPQVRHDQRAPGELDARHRTILYGIAGAGIVALVIVVLLVVLGGGGSGGGKAAAKALAAAGCQYKHYPAQPRLPHYQVLNPTPKPSWNSFPPSSGRHYYQWVLWGDYTDPVPLIKEVHNLEHGGMIIQYGNKVSKADISKISSFYRSDPNALVVAPLPKLGNKIALTAWTHLGTCTRFSQSAFKGFREAYRYKGPEHFPPAALNPGE